MLTIILLSVTLSIILIFWLIDYIVFSLTKRPLPKVLYIINRKSAFNLFRSPLVFMKIRKYIICNSSVNVYDMVLFPEQYRLGDSKYKNENSVLIDAMSYQITSRILVFKDERNLTKFKLKYPSVSLRKVRQ